MPKSVNMLHEKSFTLLDAAPKAVFRKNAIRKCYAHISRIGKIPFYFRFCRANSRKQIVCFFLTEQKKIISLNFSTSIPKNDTTAFHFHFLNMRQRYKILSKIRQDQKHVHAKKQKNFRHFHGICSIKISDRVVKKET